MSTRKTMLFALASIAAMSLQAVTLVSPKEGETVCLLNDGNRAFLEMDAAARRKIFTDKAWRHEAATKWRSVPKPVTLRWTDAKNGKVRVTVTKRGADKPWFDEDVEGDSVEVWNLEIAREYEWTVGDGGETARGTFKTLDFAPRVMMIKGVPNFRDLGGWKTVDGGRVRQGLVYRSQGLNSNANYYLSSGETMALYKAGRLEELYGKDGKKIKERIDRDGGKDDFDPNAPWMRKSLPRADPKPPKARMDEATKAYLLDKLGIRSDIDLRGPTEVWGMKESPLGPRATWFWYRNHAYGGMHEPNGKEGFTKVFRVFLDERNYPLDFHCIGGADRTGCDAWILNGLLGVAEDDLMKDWELTCFEYESQSFGHQQRIAHFLEGLCKYPGATMKEKCESYVKALGFTDADIAKFRSIMLEGAADALAPSAPEVPVFDGARREFLEMTPEERRAKFTDAEWRSRVGSDYAQIRWREAREGESSRWRRMDGVLNVRDLGGLKGLGGKTVAKGMVFRSAQLNTAAPYHLVTNEQNKAVREYYGSCRATMTPEQVAAARKAFGIKTDLDLRAAGQCRGMKGSPLGDGVRFVNVPSSNYAGIFKGDGAKMMADALRVFADESSYPVIFHCVKGADRTGSVAYILHSLLGVSAEDRLLDWELTAFSNPNPKFAHADRYDKMVKRLAEFPGETDAEKAAAYAKSIGISDGEIAKIREILLR